MTNEIFEKNKKEIKSETEPTAFAIAAFNAVHRCRFASQVSVFRFYFHFVRKINTKPSKQQTDEIEAIKQCLIWGIFISEELNVCHWPPNEHN